MLDILAYLHKAYAFNKHQEWRKISEHSIIIKLWSYLFEALFEEESDIELVWGETMNEKFKVDLRICLRFDNKNFDLSNIEFKKDGDSSQSMLKDEGKVLVEGKTIFNNWCKINNCGLEGAKKMEVIVGQFCGLKANSTA